MAASYARTRGRRLDPRCGLPEHGTNTAGERGLQCGKTMGAPTRTREEQAVALDRATVERKIRDSEVRRRVGSTGAQPCHLDRRSGQDAHRRAPPGVEAARELEYDDAAAL